MVPRPFLPFSKDILSILPSFNFVEMSRSSQFCSPFPRGRMARNKVASVWRKAFERGRRPRGGVVLAFLILHAKFVVSPWSGFRFFYLFFRILPQNGLRLREKGISEKPTCVSLSPSLCCLHLFFTLSILTVGLGNTHAKYESDTKYSLGELT